MRILLMHNRYRDSGGEDAVVAQQLSLLRSAGHQVALHEERNPEGYKAALPMLAAPWNHRSASRALSAIKRFAPDVVHLHNSWFSMSASVTGAAALAGVPLVMTLHNYRLVCANAMLYRDGSPCTLCLTGSAWNGLRHRCYRSIPSSFVSAGTIAFHRAKETWLHGVRRFLVLSRFAQEKLVRAGLPSNRMVHAPNFTADPGPRAKAASDANRVLYVGRLSPEKGIERLLAAWKDRRPSRLTLTVAGDGPLANRIRQTKDIDYVGRLNGSEVRQLMLSSRALLFPTQWFEGQPMVVVEALSAGLPVLGSKLGATAELLSALGPDWMPDPASSADWLRGLVRLEEDARVEAASASARQAYERQHTPNMALTRLESVYRDALTSSA